MIFHPGITHLRTSLEKQNRIKYIAKLRTKVQWTCAKFVVSEPLSLNEMISALAILLSFYSFLLRTTLKTLTSALFAGLHSMNFKLCVSNMIKRSVSAAMSDFRLLWVHSLTDLSSSLIYGAFGKKIQNKTKHKSQQHKISNLSNLW